MPLMQLLMVLQMGLPRLIELIMHYRDLSNGEGPISETDKTRMKENLRGLRLPDWDTL